MSISYEVCTRMIHLESQLPRKGITMSKYLFLLSILTISCGVREVDTTVSADKQLVGVWDSVNCQDRLALNDDKTFAWVDTDTSMGSYWLNVNQINFKFSNKLSESYQFEVTDRELTLVRQNVQYQYVKVPPVFKNGQYTVPPPSEKTSNLSSLCK